MDFCAKKYPDIRNVIVELSPNKVESKYTKKKKFNVRFLHIRMMITKDTTIIIFLLFIFIIAA